MCIYEKFTSGYHDCRLICPRLFPNRAVQDIDNMITGESALKPLRYLASDELMGRSPKRPEIQLAADYIADQFRMYGVEKI